MSSLTDREEKNKILPGVLYLVATPIGNLADVSQRALKVLSEVDLVAAEDTRNTLKFLTHFGISKPLVSYFEHNKRQRGEEIVASLKDGKAWALVTDAGTPAISDPGEDLVKLCAEEGISVTLIPGACAVINALALSALSARRFVYEGFLEGKAKDKREYLNGMKNEKRTMVFYEAPHNLVETLALMKEAFGESRKISLCRELTKLNEEILRCDLAGATAYYTEHAPRGEYVLVVEGASDTHEGEFWAEMTVSEQVAHYIALGLSKMDAIKQTARDRGVPKGVIYKEMLDE
ncbi:MAG: 16S rRNA (cytidine(1402)-2'-O)-methyltransferase [Clostridia bacterium]|nr:16S rRNA (cytidine(1402)-2'-O)-methyltransferase [Clostridia bacterium]